MALWWRTHMILQPCAFPQWVAGWDESKNTQTKETTRRQEASVLPPRDPLIIIQQPTIESLVQLLRPLDPRDTSTSTALHAALYLSGRAWVVGHMSTSTDRHLELER